MNDEMQPNSNNEDEQKFTVQDLLRMNNIDPETGLPTGRTMHKVEFVDNLYLTCKEKLEAGNEEDVELIKEIAFTLLVNVKVFREIGMVKTLFEKGMKAGKHPQEIDGIVERMQELEVLQRSVGMLSNIVEMPEKPNQPKKD